jgi:hypothetical protein
MPNGLPKGFMIYLLVLMCILSLIEALLLFGLLPAVIGFLHANYTQFVGENEMDDAAEAVAYLSDACAREAGWEW